MLEQVIPVGDRVLVRKDPLKRMTKGGIHLPDKVVIPNLTGRVLGISEKVKKSGDYPELSLYARVVFAPGRAVPCDFEDRETLLLVIPVEDIVAIIEKGGGEVVVPTT